MREGTRQNRISALAALLLLAAFAASILLVLLTGAGAYRRLVDRDEADFSRRTAAQYIATRVRQNDTGDGGNWENAVTVEYFQGAYCLTLREWNNGYLSDYVTRLYYHDGSLWELYTSTDIEAELTDGERVMDLKNMTLALEDGLLEAVLTMPDGETQTVRLALRSGEVVAP